MCVPVCMVGDGSVEVCSQNTPSMIHISTIDKHNSFLWWLHFNNKTVIEVVWDGKKVLTTHEQMESPKSRLDMPMLACPR